jgi:hypothetical protein
MSCLSNSTNSSQQSSSNDNNQKLSTGGYLKDHFNVSFFDCKCCCDASKEMSQCQNGSLDFLRNIQEYLHLPEYRLNCRCICDDNHTPMKFGINLTPANDLK